MNRRGKIISYILNENLPASDRLSVGLEVEHKFPCEDYFSIIPMLVESLEDLSEVPSLDHLRDEHEYSYIDEIDDTVKKQADVVDLLEEEYKDHLQDQIISHLSVAVDSDHENVDELIVDVRKTVDQYDQKLDIHRKRQTAKELYQERVEHYAGLQSFIDPIDDCVPLFETGEMSCVAGAPGHFKTTVTLNMMYQNIVQRGKDCVFLSLEMKREEIYDRLLVKHTHHENFNQHVPLSKLKSADLTKREQNFLFDVVEKDLQENDDYGNFCVLDFYDINSFTISGLRSAISRQDVDPVGVFVDYAQILRNEPLPIDNYQANPINYFVRQFNMLKDDVDGTGQRAHVCLLSQVNRDGYRRAVKSNGKYDVDSLSESNAIDRNTHQIWSIYSPNVLKEQNKAKVFMIKNRSDKDHDMPQDVKVSDFFEDIMIGEDGEKYDERDFDLDESLKRLAEGGEF